MMKPLRRHLTDFELQMWTLRIPPFHEFKILDMSDSEIFTAVTSNWKTITTCRDNAVRMPAIVESWHAKR